MTQTTRATKATRKPQSAQATQTAQPAQTTRAAWKARTVELREASFADSAQVHAFIAEKLAFPAHYGGNLAALSDCLGDIAKPLTIRIVRAEEGGRHNWFGRICTVVQRCAQENPWVSVVVSDAGGRGDAGGKNNTDDKSVAVD